MKVAAPPFDVASAELARAHQACASPNPVASLGLLEEIPVQLAGVQRTAMPSSRPAAAILFASDTRFARHGVSAYPRKSPQRCCATSSAAERRPTCCEGARGPLTVVGRRVNGAVRARFHGRGPILRARG